LAERLVIFSDEQDPRIHPTRADTLLDRVRRRKIGPFETVAPDECHEEFAVRTRRTTP